MAGGENFRPFFYFGIISFHVKIHLFNPKVYIYETRENTFSQVKNIHEN